ncbi:hypothetical protein FRB94_004866 [Tulasnella sp. JGI-2019a]|nr:hypothetical protein FRB93_001408 [Tulasnella sp. JGI-2019a]KAG8984320.1 hypothetical protein FRB94_004866 [Tulasnella sp. JGI-2019a]KAG9020330.1 hypothetical protein FRB95_004665 [Tulasnella sp. JGI-2019a]
MTTSTAAMDINPALLLIPTTDGFTTEPFNLPDEDIILANATAPNDHNDDAMLVDAAGPLIDNAMLVDVMASLIDDNGDAVLADKDISIGYNEDTMTIDAEAAINDQDIIMVDEDSDMDILTNGIYCDIATLADQDTVMVILD